MFCSSLLYSFDTKTWIKFQLHKRNRQIDVEKMLRPLQLGLIQKPTRRGLKPSGFHCGIRSCVEGIDHWINFFFLNQNIDSLQATKQWVNHPVVPDPLSPWPGKSAYWLMFRSVTRAPMFRWGNKLKKKIRKVLRHHRLDALRGPPGSSAQITRGLLKGPEVSKRTKVPLEQEGHHHRQQEWVIVTYLSPYTV